MRNMKYRIYPGKTVIDDVDTFITNINQFALNHGIHVQVLNAEMVCGPLHMKSAILHAIRASEEKRMATQSLSMETLLYASGERQLAKALPKMGVKKGTQSVVSVFLSDHHLDQELDRIVQLFTEHFEFINDKSVMDISKDKLKRWDIPESLIISFSSDEYEDLILEKIAFVDVIK